MPKKRSLTPADAAEMAWLAEHPQEARSVSFSKEFWAAEDSRRLENEAHELASVLPEALQIPAAKVHTAGNGPERQKALKAALRTAGAVYKGGSPGDASAHQRARAAYRREKKGGHGAEAAVAAAMEAGGFSARSYVYELRKKQKWDEDT